MGILTKGFRSLTAPNSWAPSSVIFSHLFFSLFWGRLVARHLISLRPVTLQRPLQFDSFTLNISNTLSKTFKAFLIWKHGLISKVLNTRVFFWRTNRHCNTPAPQNEQKWCSRVYKKAFLTKLKTGFGIILLIASRKWLDKAHGES